MWKFEIVAAACCGDEEEFFGIWKGARVAEEARLESVYSPKGNRGFESPSFRL